MKNICFFSCDYQMGGANVVAVNIARGLSSKYNVHMAAAFDTADLQLPDGVIYKSFSLERKRILKMHRELAPKFLRYVEENSIDVVFAIGYFSAFYIAPFFKKSKCKFVFCEHGAPANQLSDKKATIMRKLLVRRYDMTVALTKRSEQDFVKIIGASPKKVCYIYNWIDENTMAADAVYKTESKKILTVGRISAEKGFDMLADIAKGVFSKHPDWEWHIMGDGPCREEFETKIREYGIEKNIVMHGAVSGACEQFGDYSIMALTSYREGLPLVLLEAKAKKLPCISFDVVTGPSEIIRDSVNGILVPMYDIGMYTEKLCALIEDEKMRQSFSDNAFLDIDKFKKEKIICEWTELTESLSEKK